MDITWDPIWPWPVLLLVACGLLAVVVVAYRQQWRQIPSNRRALLLGLRIIAAAALIFAAMRPAVQVTESDVNSVQLLIAADASRSMTIADGPSGRTRWQALRQDLDKHSAKFQALAEKMEIRRYEFDKQVRPLDITRAEGTGDQTAIGQTLGELEREARQLRTVAVLFLTDGAQRALAPNDLDPLQGARKLAEAQAPVYPIGYGAAAASSGAVDLAVQDLLVDPVVFEKKLVPVKFQLRALGAAGKTATVRILVEDRSGKTIGESGELKPAPFASGSAPLKDVRITRASETIPIDLSFVPALPGEFKIGVEVVAVDGELLTRNNRLETILTVRQGGLRVAYFDTGRPEQRVLRMINGADKIQLDFFEIRGGKFLNRTRINPEVFDRGQYDVYILGDVPAEVFGPTLLTKLAARLNEGSGLLMTGGLQNFSAGGYGESPLVDWLPVTMTTAVARGIDPASQWTGPQPMIPTAVGLKRFVMQLATGDNNRVRWEKLAPLVGATKLKPKHELVEVWAETKNGQPLLLATEVGRARVAAFGGDTTYQWVLHDQAEEHQRFWRQMILWLARKEADSDQPIWVKVEPRNASPGAVVPIEFGARSATGEPLTDAEFSVTVSGPNGEPQTIAVRKTNDSFSADFSQTQTPGDYWIRVAAKRQGASVGLDGLTRFIVDAKDLELDQPNPDFDLLKRIAEITGGQMLQPEDLGAFLERLGNLKLEDLNRVQTWPLWDNWWLLLTFVGLLSLEWALRKRAGLA